jgi:dTDP-4-dehydrorhamnose reductase
MKILVLGAAGMAGHTIALYLQESGYDVTGFSRGECIHIKNIIGDVTDFNTLFGIIREGQFDAIINAVGILNRNAEDNKALAVLINSYLPHFLSVSTSATKTKVIHMSTDCVFSGKVGGYNEISLRDGETFYDRSKALGELDNSKDLTFRNSIIGPDCNKDGIGLFNWFMKQDGVINGYTKAIWTGVTTLTLAKAMRKALEDDLTGLYNLVNNETINKYELLKLFNRYFRNDSICIVSSNDLVIDKSLINNRKDFDFIVPSYEQMICEMKEWIVNHQELYMHYFK